MRSWKTSLLVPTLSLTYINYMIQERHSISHRIYHALYKVVTNNLSIMPHTDEPVWLLPDSYFDMTSIKVSPAVMLLLLWHLTIQHLLTPMNPASVSIHLAVLPFCKFYKWYTREPCFRFHTSCHFASFTNDKWILVDNNHCEGYEKCAYSLKHNISAHYMVWRINWLFRICKSQFWYTCRFVWIKVNRKWEYWST